MFIYDPTKTYPYDYFRYPYQQPSIPSAPWIWPAPTDVKTVPSIPFDWTNIKLSGYQITDKKVWDRYPNSWIWDRKHRTEEMEKYPERFSTLPMRKLYILMPAVSRDRLEVTQEEQLLYVRLFGLNESWDKDYKTAFAAERQNSDLAKLMDILDKNKLSNNEYVFDLDRTYQVLNVKLENGILEIEFSKRNPEESFKKDFSIG